MTKENALRAYNFALEQGRQDIAENILIRHPEFLNEKEEEEKPKSDKKK